jgi:molecular chaperone GrpE
MSETEPGAGAGPASGAAPRHLPPPGAAAAQGGHAEAGQPDTAHPGDASGRARIAELQARIAQAEERIARAEDLRLRALADLDNVRKRCAVQVSRAEADTLAAVTREWLPILDNLDLALEHSKSDPAAIIDGIRAVRDQALAVVGRLGFPRRDDAGAMFDPARHDAVAVRTDPSAAAGSVIEVMRPAYGDGDHQLRPAQVVVAKAD